jgi:hypothetical protein
MADFALWATACEAALWKPGTFGRAYGDNRAALDEVTIEGDTVATAVRSLMAERTSWNGIAQELLPALAALGGEAATRAKSWPATPRALSGRLRRVAPNLRRVGINIIFGARESSQRPITIETADKVGKAASPPSQQSSAKGIRGFRGDGRDDGHDGAGWRNVIEKSSKSAIGDGIDGHDGGSPTPSDGDAELCFEPGVSRYRPKKGRLIL